MEGWKNSAYKGLDSDRFANHISEVEADVI